nr:immunoglobulin light chain junction region [Macaca mulatta]
DYYCAVWHSSPCWVF